LANYFLYQNIYNDQDRFITVKEESEVKEENRFTELQSDAENHVLREGQENGEPLDMRQLHAIVTALGDITQVLK